LYTVNGSSLHFTTEAEADHFSKSNCLMTIYRRIDAPADAASKCELLVECKLCGRHMWTGEQGVCGECHDDAVAPSPHVETGGQEDEFGVTAGRSWTADEGGFGGYSVEFTPGRTSKERAESAADWLNRRTKIEAEMARLLESERNLRSQLASQADQKGGWCDGEREPS
jgi:hypothetical protein